MCVLFIKSFKSSSLWEFTREGDGGRSKGGLNPRYFLFSIPVEFGKRCEYADYGEYRQRCETVYVREVKDLPVSNKKAEGVVKR